jgi:hypothetical protein
MDQAELDEVLRIAMDYFRSQTSSEEEAQKMLGELAKTVEDPGAKLVHLGNYLFLVMVRGKEYVEIHTIGDESNPRELIKNFELLAAYLKNIGVKVAYTYSPDKKFLRLAKLTNLKVQNYESTVDGKKMNVFMVEL